MDKNPHMDTVSANLSDPEVHCACGLALATWKVLTAEMLKGLLRDMIERE